jgi:hypothetical protein
LQGALPLVLPVEQVSDIALQTFEHMLGLALQL